MNKANRDKLKALELEQLKERYPSMREEMIPLTDWKDNSANNLTKCIIFWIKAMSGQAERISNQGQYRAGNKIQVGAYQQDVERAGGTYYIAKDFDSFVLWYESFSLHL